MSLSLQLPPRASRTSSGVAALQPLPARPLLCFVFFFGLFFSKEVELQRLLAAAGHPSSGTSKEVRVGTAGRGRQQGRSKNGEGLQGARTRDTLRRQEACRSHLQQPQNVALILNRPGGRGGWTWGTCHLKQSCSGGSGHPPHSVGTGV